MKIFRVATGRTIAPFGDLARDLYIGTKTLAEWQNDAAAATNLELVDVASIDEVNEAPCYVFYDDVWFTEMVLRHFVADTMSQSATKQIAIEPSLVTEAVGPMQDARDVGTNHLGYDVFFCPEKPTDEAQLFAAAPQVVEKKELRGGEVKLPPASVGGEGRGSGTTVAVPLTTRIVANVRHWLHLLKLSQLSIGVALLDRLRHSPRLLLRLRLKRNRDPWALAGEMKFIDPTARVHPTAHVEASIIGPNAVVEAHAHVHRSVIGEGVLVGDHAAVMGATLASGVHVLRSSYLANCASMPDATLASYKVQLSLFGREVFLTSAAWLIDAKLEGEVRVRSPDGDLVPVGPFLGCCLGHRVTLGAQVALAAGRAVPNGLTIVGPPEHFLTDVEGFPEGTVLAVRGGRAKPIG